jgi:MscS family membrane protein
MEFLDHVYLGNSAQRWFVAFGILLGSLIFGRIVAALVKSVGSRLKSPFLSSIAAGIGGPLTSLITIIGFRISTESLELPTGVKELAAKAVIFLTVVTFTWAAANAYDAVNKGVFEPYSRKPNAAIDLHVFAVLRTIINGLIWVIGVASGLNSIGFEVSAILAGLGIGGMALALASQDTVANFFGGVLVLTQRPFKVGERIEVAGINGWVTQFGLRHTIIKNWYGREVLVPNKKFTDNTIVNIDSQGCYFQEVRPRLAPDTTPEELEKALQILRDLVKDNDLLDKTPWVAFDRIDHGFFELEFWYAVLKWSAKESDTIPNEYEKVCRGKTWVNIEILKRFHAAGIRLAVPLQAYVAQEPGAHRTPPFAIASRNAASSGLSSMNASQG